MRDKRRFKLIDFEKDILKIVDKVKIKNIVLATRKLVKEWGDIIWTVE